LRFCLDTFLAHPKSFVYVSTVERDRALEQLEKVATLPNGITYGNLRFNPWWDSFAR